jgi:hypothetical protein
MTNSQVDGEFSGWEGETLIKLFNGEVWQQSEYWYHYHYSYMPKVTITDDGGGIRCSSRVFLKPCESRDLNDYSFHARTLRSESLSLRYEN